MAALIIDWSCFYWKYGRSIYSIYGTREWFSMGKYIDLTGQRIGNLTVLELDKKWYRDGRKHWICKCDCGNICSISSSILRNNKRKTYSCGCQSSPLIDLTGQSFGEWKVLKLDKENSKNQHAYWICQCSCGTIRSIEGRTLRNFHSQSCGCKKISYGETIIKQILIINHIVFEQQKTFENCINILPLYFDFYLPDYNTCIEYDGQQHFEPIELFGGLEYFKHQQENDNIKNLYCKTNHINLIRIPYTLSNITLLDLLPNTSNFCV